MKRKISILTLTFLFFASTTGLPIVMHYCEMMESMSLEVCEMHQEEVVKTSCCEEKSNAEINFSKAIDPCCTDKLVDSSIKDNFVISKADLLTKIQLPAALFISINFNLSEITSQKFYTDSSPPLFIDNHLYITNSIFLI